MSFEVKEKNFVLVFDDISIEDAMKLKDVVMKHLHQKNISKISKAKDVSGFYNLSLAMSNDRYIREETFNIIRKYAKKFNKIPLNEETAIGIIFSNKENWDKYGAVYAKIYEEAVTPFLNLPKYMLSTFMKEKSK